MGILDSQGPVSAAERLILLNATGIMLVVVVPVILLTLVFAWWYRASNTRAVYRPQWVYSGRVELVVWSIPAMVVMLLAGVEWIGSHELDPRRPLRSGSAPVRIQVVSLDWKWLFVYPDQHVAAVNELVVPAGSPIEFDVTSATVMNAFFVPQLGTQIYAMPGMTTRVNLMADRAGLYPGLSSHFSGDGFSDMRFDVRAVAPAEFERWVERVRSGSQTLDRDAYQALARPARTVGVTTYRAFDDRLFQDILSLSTPAIRPPER